MNWKEIAKYFRRYYRSEYLYYRSQFLLWVEAYNEIADKYMIAESWSGETAVTYFYSNEAK